MNNSSNENDPLQDLVYIKDIMEKSSRFISLSGLSGVFAGIFAIVGAIVAELYLNNIGRDYQDFANNMTVDILNYKAIVFIIADACIVALLSVICGVYFTYRQSQKKGLKIWDKTSKRLLVNLFIPLAAGGIFCLILFYYNLFALVAPCTLIFYGFACFNAGKYTHDEVRYLGISEIALGLLGSLYLGYGYVIWIIGFGLLHILYGLLMYFKYEKGK
jgi:hypothetical protein